LIPSIIRITHAPSPGFPVRAKADPYLARVGARYSDDWHRTHLRNPRDLVPESNMPGYPWLAKTPASNHNVVASMRALKSIGVPYADADIATAGQAIEGKTEEDAVIAYLQDLGTLIKARR
jgi:cytochrome c oxidase cbb3-type subunit 2